MNIANLISEMSRIDIISVYLSLSLGWYYRILSLVDIIFDEDSILIINAAETLDNKDGRTMYKILDLCIRHRRESFINWICKNVGYGSFFIHAYYGHNPVDPWIEHILATHGYDRASVPDDEYDLFMRRMYLYRHILGIPYPCGSEKVPIPSSTRQKYDMVPSIYHQN